MRCHVRYVPSVRESAHLRESQCLARRADPDTWARLDWLRITDCVDEREELAAVLSDIFGPEQANNFDCFGESPEPLRRWIEREPVTAVFRLMPTRPQAELQSPVRNVIDSRRGVRQHRRVAVRRAVHQ